MNRLIQALTVLAVVALGLPASTAAQESFAMDPDLAKRGQKVWQNGGCMICHTLGRGQGAGPDLAGVYERRSIDWITRFLKNTEEMLQTDSIAKALLVEYRNIKMPNVKLTDRDISAVLHYIVRETQELRGG
jgi:mono/diheme cytochrome c family protein